MVPRLVGRAVGLKPRILDRYPVQAPDPLLLHSHPVEVTLAPLARTSHLPQLLASIVHPSVHPRPLLLYRLLLGPLEQQPRAVNGPMPEPPQTTHAQRRRRGREHVLLENLDASVELGPDDTLVPTIGAGFVVGGLRFYRAALLDHLHERARRGYPSHRGDCR